ncbi:hypothetical protein Tco_0299858 [Tanacetum coccineum]
MHPNAYSSTVHQDACPQPQSISQIEYNVSIVNQQTQLAEFPQIDSSLAVSVFKQGDDPIVAINKMMSFLSAVVSSRFPTTNNQLRNSSNPRQQVTIHNGRVTVQSVQERQSSFAVDTSGTRANISGIGPGKVLNEEELEFLADPGDAEAKAILMTNLSSYGSDVLSKEKEAKNIDNEIALEKKVKEMDNIVSLGFQNPFYLKKAQQIRPMLYDGSVIAKETNVISIADSEETLMLEEESRSKMLLKQSDPKVLEKKVNIKPI